MSESIVSGVTLRSNSTAATVIRDFATLITGIAVDAEERGLVPIWDRLDSWVNVDRDETTTLTGVQAEVTEYRTLSVEVLAVTKGEAGA